MKKLAEIKWELFKEMDDVDDMETLWSKEINDCLNFVAPWKTRRIKRRKYCLPKKVQEVIKVGKELEKKYQCKLQNCEQDFELEKKLKKRRNYCNKLVKQPV